MSSLPKTGSCRAIALIAAVCLTALTALPAVASAAPPLVVPTPPEATTGQPVPPLVGPCATIAAEHGTSQEMADRYLQRAVERYEADDHIAALVAIDLAECHQARANYDYMRAVIHAGLGECRRARYFAERFDASSPAALDAAALRHELGECATAAAEPTAPPTVRPRPVERAPRSLAEIGPQQADEDMPLPRRDVAGGVLLGLGIASLAAGAIVMVEGRPVGAPSTFAAFEREQAQAQRSRWIGGSLIAAGTSLVIGSAIRYSLLYVRARRARASTMARR